MQPYVPNNLPVNNFDLLGKLDLIVEASNNLVRYDEKLKTLPNPTIFLSPLQKKEAVKSSKIEGTRTTLDQVLQSEADLNTNVDDDDDLREVLNYRDAMTYAIDGLNQRPLNLNLVKEVQDKLLTGVRGSDRSRGQFRKELVWIGPPGSSQAEAHYVPPKWESVDPLMGNWEAYIHSTGTNPLVQTAIMHAQFEMIHPFVDGNGRVGRILIPLQLYQKGLISQPMFYLSGYLEENRDEYIESLSVISKNNDWDTWIKFFLKAVNDQAKRNLDSVNEITSLYNQTKQTVTTIKSPYQSSILDALFMFPYFTSTRFAQTARIQDRGTAIRLINKLEELEIIVMIRPKAGNKPALYLFPKLYKIIK